MADEAPFLDLMERVRGGDGDAAAELVRRYEPAIRRVVRLRPAHRNSVTGTKCRDHRRSRPG
jgi:hypothetical protein